ncbi:ABC transporter ATP-binding protein [Methyloligella sp. 2.7D]|uniref:ABC transporter ATP-binding protein n=1 Tax=unclassified Methyloligella TaxID=2625955 RepID=UPI00157DE83D|nr:ABC transporter ATP-binding protein [Methyloligella sp. GL2]QKP77920.1 ABC transporter ATP-binding protein [Methyloligella sp. GL2]
MTDATPLLRLRGLTKSYDAHVALHPTDLEVERGDFLALLGPSGCGKTTLLRMIGGFLSPDRGRVEIDGQDVTALGPEQRNTNIVFQSYGLFPHMTVRQNVGFGLRVAKRGRAERDRDTAEILELMHLAPFADRLPAALSGGQQQRVALARALVMKPSVLLLDEPLAALDLQLRKAMQEELRNLHHEIGGTFVYVTHDQSEAMALANRVAVMDQGRIVQEQSPEAIYRHPRTRFVANFIGESNLLAAERKGDTCHVAGTSFPLQGPDGKLTLMVRPSNIRLGRGKAGCPKLPATIAEAVFMGDYWHIRLKLQSGEDLIVHQQQPSGQSKAPQTGGSTTAFWEPADCHVIDET